MSRVLCPEIIEFFPDELAGVVGALSETPTVAAVGTQLPGPGYLVTIVAADGGHGVLFVHLDHEGAGVLARRALGSTEELPVEGVMDALKDLCGQAATAIVDRKRLDDVRLKVDDVEIAASVPDGQPVTLAELTVEGETVPAQVALWGSLELGDVPSFPEVHVSAGSPAGHPSHSDSPNVDVILDMELPLVVRFGRTEMSLKALTSLAPGAVIDLGRSPDDPVEVLVSNQVVARGEVVTVAGNYGVRITDIISPAERARYMEVIS
jgi:flagellar motor switch protein FliN